MSLSIRKLEKVLLEKGFMPNKYFLLDGRLNLVEIVSLKNATKIMITIPKKYVFELKGNEENVLKLREIVMDIEDIEEVAGKYSQQDINNSAQQSYEIEDDEIHKKSEEDIMDSLLNEYRHPIKLRELRKDNIIDVKDIFRQLKRLKYAVQTLKYKISLMYKSYICVLNTDDTIECFYIRNYEDNDSKRGFSIVVNLELLYDNLKTIEQDTTHINTEIYKMLDKNHLSHSKKLQDLVDTKIEKLEESSISLYRKKEKIESYIASFENLLQDTMNKEKVELEKLYELENNDTNEIHKSYSFSRNKANMEKRLEHLGTAKRKVIRNIIDLKNKRENLTLYIDKILFDSIVMLDSVFKNLKTLDELSREK
jgi:hypothetical protein